MQEAPSETVGGWFEATAWRTASASTVGWQLDTGTVKITPATRLSQSRIISGQESAGGAAASGAVTAGAGAEIVAGTIGAATGAAGD